MYDTLLVLMLRFGCYFIEMEAVALQCGIVFFLFANINSYVKTANQYSLRFTTP
jgi:hypothetical protein